MMVQAGIFPVVLSSLLLCWLVHVVWWRIARPADDLKVLFALMVVGPAVVAAIGAGWLCGPTQAAFAGLLAAAIGCVYCFWYPAAQAASPTMLIALLARRERARGIDLAQLQAALPEDKLVREGIDNLFHEAFAKSDENGRVYLLPRGQRTLAFIQRLRALAGYRLPPRG